MVGVGVRGEGGVEVVGVGCWQTMHITAVSYNNMEGFCDGLTRLYQG